MAYNKWILGGLGWAMYEPIGAVIGFAIGTVIDHYQEQLRNQRAGAAQGAGPTAGAAPGGDLTTTLIVLTAALMKADGKVTHRELDHVRSFFIAQFGIPKAGQLLIVLREVLKQDIAIHDICRQTRQGMPYPVRLQLMHYLLGLANADGRVERSEFDLLRTMAREMGIGDQDLGSLSAMFRTNDPSAAYDILEIPSTATDDEVKKAYRRMAMKYHPDKVAQLGEEVQKAATEKFKKVQEAYETIQKQRGLK